MTSETPEALQKKVLALEQLVRIRRGREEKRIDGQPASQPDKVSSRVSVRAYSSPRSERRRRSSRRRRLRRS